ncbi:molybdate ABC transporter substrate-binding protein [Bordetella petrii]|uniref:molybdate ABC transporter substrate-binding protein n=1 Tax=Bordetella petrii TaxID=94624 RepID=UPI001A96C734|nr:substrate-binding domain-containing protein [Bordetella petrii]MBO1113208.1 substrate-binding domain-containing protein [Bordetella petrii]
MKLSILSGGAALGLVDAVRARFESEAGCPIEGEFGAVGAMKEKLLAGTECDIVILSRKLVDGLADAGQVQPGSARDLGVVSTGVGVKAGDPAVAVDTPAAFGQALQDADAVYVPDMQRSTAGIHMKKVFQQLGVLDGIAAKIREFPNGATAMKAMAAAPGRPVGCTQITEILYSPGVQAVGLLPRGCELDTVYTAAVAAGARQAGLARKLIEMLTDSSLDTYKNAHGFRV